MIANFIDRRVAVLHEGRRYWVRRPSFGAVVVALQLYGQEVAALLSAAREHKETLAAGDLTVLVQAIVGRRDGRVEQLLPMIADGDGDPADWPAAKIIAASMRLADLPRIGRSLKIDPKEPDGDVDSEAIANELDAQTIGLCRSAEFLHVSPVVLMGWPFEAYLDASEFVIAEMNARNQQARASSGEREVGNTFMPGVSRLVVH